MLIFDALGICAVTFITVVADVVTEKARGAVLSEMLYDDDLELMSETIDGFTNKFRKWK